MSNEETRREESAEEPETSGNTTEESEQQTDAEGSAGAEQSAAKEETSDVGALQEQLQQHKDEVLRAKAEMQNIRRRSEIDVEKAHKFALEKFVKELLPVLDSLEKAVESTEGHEVQNEEVVARIKEGVDMTLDMFLRTLEKFNVEQINPVGEPFDPQRHEAMSMVPSSQAEPNTVIAVMQKGYALNERVVRPAMVMVAKAEESSEGGNVDEQA